jgi:ABC-2 type transport system permease protein
VYKQSGSFANLIQNGLLFLNGSILPVDNMPGWLSGLARTLPSTQGVVVLRQVVLKDRSLAAVWRDGSLVWLVVHSAAWFAAGWLIFGLCQGIAKRQGSLGQY